MTSPPDLALERGRIERGNGELRVVLPSRAPGVYAVFVSIWLVFVVYFFVDGPTAGKPATPFSWLFVLVFGVGAVAVAGLLLWSLVGKEVIVVREGVLELSRRVPGFSFGVRTFALGSVHEMREDQPGDRQPVTNGWPHIFGLIGGAIAFRYQGATHRFGAKVGVSDARTIVEAILATTPERVDATNDEAAFREASVIERKRGILIDVPPARVQSVTRTSLLFLFIAAVMVFMLVTAMVTGQKINGPPVAFLAMGVVLPVIVGWALLSLIANLWRRESVAVDETTIVIDRSVFGMHFRTELAIVPEAKLWLDEKHTEEAEMSGGARRGVVMKAPFNTGPIVYQGAQGQLFRFGNGLSKAEASWLVGRIHEKSPTLIN